MNTSPGRLDGKVVVFTGAGGGIGGRVGAGRDPVFGCGGRCAMWTCG